MQIFYSEAAKVLFHSEVIWKILSLQSVHNIDTYKIPVKTKLLPRFWRKSEEYF